MRGINIRGPVLALAVLVITAVAAHAGDARNKTLNYTLRVPGGWEEVKKPPSRDIAQMFARQGSQTDSVTVEHMSSPYMPAKYLRNLMGKSSKQNSLLAKRVSIDSLKIGGGGSGVIGEFTGSKNKTEYRSLVLYLSIDGHLFIVTGSVSGRSGARAWDEAKSVVESFKYGLDGAILGRGETTAKSEPVTKIKPRKTAKAPKPGRLKKEEPAPAKKSKPAPAAPKKQLAAAKPASPPPPPKPGVWLRDKRNGFEIQTPGGWRELSPKLDENVVRRFVDLGGEATLEIFRYRKNVAKAAKAAYELERALIPALGYLNDRQKSEEKDIKNSSAVLREYYGFRAGREVRSIILYTFHKSSLFAVAGVYPKDKEKWFDKALRDSVNSFGFGQAPAAKPPEVVRAPEPVKPSRPAKTPKRPKPVVKESRPVFEEKVLTSKLTVNSSPKGASIFINGEFAGKAPLKQTLEMGHYRVEAKLRGHRSKTWNVQLEPGLPVEISIDLEKDVQSATVIFGTRPPGGTIFFQGKNIGSGEASKENIPFGDYEAGAVKMIDKRTRLKGSTKFTVFGSDLTRVTVPLGERERIFEGKWYPEKKAIAREEARYRKQRTGNPVEVTVEISVKSLKGLGKPGAVAERLFSLLRVGDRVNFEFGKKSQTVWKRHRKTTYEFNDEISSALAGKTASHRFNADIRTKRASVKAGKNPMAQIAFALHGARSPYPLIDLGGVLLTGGGETVSRSAGDGWITVLVYGGEEVKAAGAKFTWYDALGVAWMKPGDTPVTLSWKKKPGRLMLVSDAKSPLLNPPHGEKLKIRQKKIVQLAQGAQVSKVTRFSNGPGFKGWKKEVFTAEGPLAAQIDLSKNEIGPHEANGVYRRVWIVSYKSKSGASQRQARAEYTVSSEVKETTTDIFLRQQGLPAGKRDRVKSGN